MIFTLLDQYKMLHAMGKFPGYSIEKHIPQIKALIARTNAKTLLDYGCGKGWQYSEKCLHEEWGNIMPILYDPAVHGLDRKPVGQFDGVICTDVLEHLPEEDIPQLIDELYGYARKFLFVSICTREAKKKLPDGRNCHLTIRPREWWLETIGTRHGIATEVAWNDEDDRFY